MNNVERFNEQRPKWKRYLYSDDEYRVDAPQSIEEIIQEGAALHHDVKSCINQICDGKVVILFIRRHDEPNKPFYTLEIRNNAICECWGGLNGDNNNKDVFDTPGLVDFLENYRRACKINIDINCFFSSLPVYPS